MRQLETLTKAMTRRKIRIKFSGDGASTDGNTITLPSFGAGAELSDKQLQLIRGYCDHETAHIQNTDFGHWYSADSRSRRLVNIIEDIRIERLAAATYPGVRDNLAALNAELLHESDNAFSQLMVEGYRQVSGFNVPVKSYDAEVKVNFGADIIDRMKALESTADAIQLAYSIIDAMSNKQQHQEQELLYCRWMPLLAVNL